MKILEVASLDFAGSVAGGMMSDQLWTYLLKYLEKRAILRGRSGTPTDFKELTKEVGMLARGYPTLTYAYLEWLTVKEKILQSGGEGAILPTPNIEPWYQDKLRAKRK